MASCTRSLDVPAAAAPSITMTSAVRDVGCRSGETPLACLKASSLSLCYHAWRGITGKRYTTSIFPVDDLADGHGLPSFRGFVLISAVRRAGTLHPSDIVAVESETARLEAIAFGLTWATSEWHVHFLAGCALGRQAVVDDLLARHEPQVAMTLSA